MLMKTVKLYDRKVTFKSSADILRLYHIKFKRDIFKDLARLEKSCKTKQKTTSALKSTIWRSLRMSPISWRSMLNDDNYKSYD